MFLSFRNSQEHALDMRTTTTTASGGGGPRATPHLLQTSKERASVIIASSPVTGHRPSASAAGGISDPVIDEHFRRSLGKDYMNVFAPPVAAPQQQRQQVVDRQPLRTTAAGPTADAGLSGRLGAPTGDGLRRRPSRAILNRVCERKKSPLFYFFFARAIRVKNVVNVRHKMNGVKIFKEGASAEQRRDVWLYTGSGVVVTG